MSNLLKEQLKEHKRIIFNGNNYSDEWVVEAEKRGLLNLKTTADALPHYMDEKNVVMFARQGIYTRKEMEARMESILEEYHKVLHIEALTMLDMAKTEIIPAVLSYSKEVAETLLLKKQFGNISFATEEDLLSKLSAENDRLMQGLNELEQLLADSKAQPEGEPRAKYYRDCILPKMNDIRAAADTLEGITAAKYWPFPTYSQLLFY